MELLWTDDAWREYLYWQKNNKQILKRINELIKVIQRTPFEGIGKSEALRYDLAGFWSRRIDQEHRLVYAIEGETIKIVQCKNHY